MSRCEYGANHVDGPCIHCEAKALRSRVAELETPTVEVRRNEDGSLDEVVASRANVHLEQMSVDCWWLRIGEVEITIHTLHRARIVANVEEVEP